MQECAPLQVRGGWWESIHGKGGEKGKGVSPISRRFVPCLNRGKDPGRGEDCQSDLGNTGGVLKQASKLRLSLQGTNRLGSTQTYIKGEEGQEDCF